MTRPMSRRSSPRLCFVNLHAYPALVPHLQEERIGGEEVQHSLLAGMFAKAGYDVSLVTGDFGQPDGEQVDGVRVLTSYSDTEGVPVIRFLHPRWTRLHAALKRADADLYYVSCAGALVGQVRWFAERHRRRVIFRVASDTDCDPQRLLVPTARDRWLYHYGLRGADVVLAQTEFQQGLLQTHYGLPSQLVPMVLDVPQVAPPHAGREIDVLWVANLRELKRPELFVEAARRLPQYRFHLVGGRVEKEPHVDARVRELARGVANLTLHGRVGFQDTLALFDRARLFVSTSLIEGFPNTFLQAWAREVPSLSFFDPDGVVQAYGLGLQIDSVEALVEAIATHLGQPEQLRDAAAACGRFMQARYSAERLITPYQAAFERALQPETRAA
jgi:glycosyltransferase involved in cell wall biosynthesis